MKKIGVLYGQENAFPTALIEKINSMKVPGLVAEAVMVDLVKQGMSSEYAVIIDRISHDVPFYRSYLKTVALSGTVVINNPFWWSADEKFINNTIAMQIGIPVPKTYLLPSNQMPPETTANSFRNLKFPINWEKIAKDIKFPAYMKPHAGGGWKHVYRVESLNDLWNKHNLTGDLVMMVQEEIVFESYYRCYCIGGKYVHIMPYEPRNPHDQRYIQQDPQASQALLDTIRDYTLRLNQALGYEFNTVEFAVRKGVPYAIDFCNPAPDADLHSVGKENFAWVVKHMALYAVERALAQTADTVNLNWGSTLVNAIQQSLGDASLAPAASSTVKGRKGSSQVKLAAITTEPKRRGRPAKAKTEVAEETTAPKRRGRPAKEKVAVAAADATPKRRGRPAKPKTEAADTTPKRRGRPAKEKVVVASDAAPKRRGRPAKPKAEVVDTTPKRRGRPAKEKVAVATDAAPKRRGRPAKPKAAAAESAPKRRGRPAKEKTVVATDAAPKRRGRPAKEKPVAEVSTTTKRRGRPAKPKAESAEMTTTAKRRGRPAKETAAMASDNTPKRRGRPAKASTATENTETPKKRGRKPNAEKATAIKKPKKAKMAITSGNKEEKPKSKRGRKPKANKVVKPKRVKIEKPMGELMGIDAVLASEKLIKN